MIKNMHRVLILKKDVELAHDIKFSTGTEFETLNGVVYMGGVPIHHDFNFLIYTWIVNNPQQFKDVTSTR